MVFWFLCQKPKQISLNGGEMMGSDDTIQRSRGVVGLV